MSCGALTIPMNFEYKTDICMQDPSVDLPQLENDLKSVTLTDQTQLDDYLNNLALSLAPASRRRRVRF
jgi:hypothetical protein